MGNSKKNENENIAYAPADWSGFSLRLVSFYRGAPTGVRDGVSNRPVFAVWKLLAGEVLVRADGMRFSAKSGDWLVCQPGERYQRFSENARIVSLHFHLESARRLLLWSGPYAVRLPHDTRLDAALRSLTRAAERWELPSDRVRQRLHFHLPLPGLLEVEEASFGFFRELLGKLADQDLRLEPVGSANERVATSFEALAAQPLDTPFSRASLAERAGLSASRLDRRWREDFGLTPFQYWDRRRYQAACEHLAAERRSIKEIAHLLGFARLARFSAWFRTHAGESPRGFRASSLGPTKAKNKIQLNII